MDQMNHNTPGQGWDFPPEKPVIHTAPSYPTGKKELIFGIFILALGWLLCNSTLFGGFNLGFALFLGGSILCAAIYLLCTGRKPTAYSAALLILSLVITAGFARTDDGFVKFVMFCFLGISINLGLCIQARQNRFAPGSVRSLLDAPVTFYGLGVGRLPESFRGLKQAFRRSGSVGKKSSAVLLGLGISLVLLCIMIPLLASADAAFEGVIDQLPELEIDELFSTAILGTGLACLLYTRAVALRHAPKPAPTAKKNPKGISPLTVNTVLGAVSLVYLVYLVSQLAYFSGGFAGILPQGYTMAEYARRGFFEMAWLCAINLSIMALSVGLVSRQDKAPLSTRLLCLFLGIVTLFLVATASAKMFLYIGSYGLTRLRVLTEVIMLFVGITTLLVTVWLFLPKLPYMKAVLLVGLAMGAVVIWADVDTLVARYNVTAYQSGAMETIDISYLNKLGSGAVPYIQALTDDKDEAVADAAKAALESYWIYPSEDFRGWNYTDAAAKVLLQPYQKE